MKKSILVLAVFSFAASGLFISCNNSARKVEKAETNVVEAKEDLAQAKDEYQADVENFRQQTADKVAANNQSIADFNARIDMEKKEAKAEYKIKIAELEKKNSDMQKKLDDYKVESKDQWETFKAEFNNDMEKLGVALENLVGKNK